MNKTKRLLSLLTSAAMAASAFSAIVIPASAKTDVYTQDWEAADSTGFSDAGRGASSLVDNFEGNTGRAVLMNNSGGTNGTVKTTFTAVTGNHVGIAYDAYITSNYTNIKYVAVGNTGLTRMSGNAVDAANAIFTVGNSTDGNLTVNGTADTGIAPDQWVGVSAVIDFLTHTVDVTITPANGDVYNGTVDFLDNTVTEVSGLTLNSNRGVTDAAIYFDNFAISTFDEAEIEIPEDPATVETDGSAVIATVTGIEADDAVEAASSDESVVTVSVSNGEVIAEYAGGGKAVVTIKATSPDGVSVTKTVAVISGSVELADVTVKYVNSDNQEIADGYIITDVPVGNTITASEVTYQDTILTSDYRYTNPSVADYTVVNGDNILYVVYADKAAAITSITASYKNPDGEVVAEKTVDIGTDYYVGDEYTYFSNAYVQAADGVIYAVGEDYTVDVENITLNNATTAVNSVLKQTVLLDETATISYTAVESPNAAYYAEWEDILGVNASAASNSRYIASGGKLCTTTSTVEFYEVPTSGYYQIVLVGGPKKRGTAIYATKASAEAATAVDDGTALLNISSSDNNDAYGIYSAATAFLTAGDNLTIRGYGSSNTTDNLDYILIRRIVSGDIIGADGVSIVPGGQTSAFAFDSGLSEVPSWSVEGVAGVTIDQNGVLTVSDTAEEGTAVVKAEIESAGVSGTKNIAIEKAVITDFTLEGPTVVSTGSAVEYSAADVTDQFNADITNNVLTEYSTSDAEVISIDAATGAASVGKTGTAVVTVKVIADDSSLTKTVEITAKNFYLAGNATGDTTAVDASDLVASDNITGYVITTAKDGKIVNQNTVTDIPASVDTTGADSYEIDPVYTYNNLSGVASQGYIASDTFADGYYNMTFTKGDLKRADIYVNDYMVGNNVDQYGEGRAIAGNTEYSINDVVINGGSIKISTTDIDSSGNGSISKAVIVKAPSNVDRVKKVYVTGDSLVANYYGTYAAGTEVGGARTGFGQQLGNFMTDEVEVVNLANSGQYAAGLLTTAFPGIIAMAQPGDYLVLESGYNDRNYSNTTEMYNSVVSMVEQAEARGMNIVLVSPNASAHDYKPEVMYASTMTQAAADLQAKYDNVIYVNLSKLSYEFMQSTNITSMLADNSKVISAVKNEDGILQSVSISDSSTLNVTEYYTDDSGAVIKYQADRILAPTAANAGATTYLWNAIDGSSSMTPVGTTTSTQQVVFTYNLINVGGDTLHSSYAAAMKWASIVAQGMKDGGVDFINTDFSYTFTDTIGNIITCQVQ